MHAIAIHGGAGNIHPDISQEEYHHVLQSSVSAGYKILKAGGAGTEAVCAAVTVLEDSYLFNAGHGAVFNAAGDIQMDAALMDGQTLKAGAVAAVRTIKNPILAAQIVLEQSPHVLLGAEGAESFAADHGLLPVENSYFHTTHRHEQLLDAQKHNKIQLDFADDDDTKDNNKPDGQALGTVGAVALDKNGHLAAATSTGGLTNKAVGRIGDTPIIGAGTYAQDGLCAISCTGTGDEMIRIVMAYDIACQMQYQNKSIKQSCEIALQKLKNIGGIGGVITITATGKIHMPFNTRGMFRAHYTAEMNEAITAIF